MKLSRWQILLGLLLILISLSLYSAHYLIFGDAYHIWIYFLSDLAFLPIQIFFVTLLINQLMVEREKRIKIRKLNMVIDTFFSEVGTELLRSFSRFDEAASRLPEKLKVESDWKKGEFVNARFGLKDHPFSMKTAGGSLDELKFFLISKRNFHLMLLENPNLLEHDAFTDLLRAVFHLTEELGFRTRFSDLPISDLDHLAMDMTRAYRLLLLEWIEYMKHLQEDYPYLFSLAVRTNPFNPGASVIVR
jgi:hypothetical protein